MILAPFNVHSLRHLLHKGVDIVGILGWEGHRSGHVPIRAMARVEQGVSSSVTSTKATLSAVAFDYAIDTLTSKQRAHLRSLAHELKPVLHVGKEGVTDAILAAAKEAFNTRELMKIRVLENAPHDTRAAAQQLATEMEGARVVQVIGRTAVLYRQDPDRPSIQLPK